VGPRADSQAPSRAMAGSAAIFGVRTSRHRSCPIPRRFLRDDGRIGRPFHSECLLSLCGPARSRLFALIAFELVCHPEQRAEDDGAIIASQVHDRSLDDEAAEFDQVPRTLAALDLPCERMFLGPCWLWRVVGLLCAPVP